MKDLLELINFWKSSELSVQYAPANLSTDYAHTALLVCYSLFCLSETRLQTEWVELNVVVLWHHHAEQSAILLVQSMMFSVHVFQ